MSYKITIPEPCLQNWDAMLPNADGRYCNSCAKTVIDFTALSDKEIQDYFVQHQNNAICGHLKSSQLQRIVIDIPGNVFTIKMPEWMKFLIACLLIFGISIFPFETTIAGKPAEEISLFQGDIVLHKTDTLPKVIKKLRPDEAIETGSFVDGMIIPIPIILSPKKVKVKVDSTIKCKPEDSLKTDIVIDSKVHEPNEISSLSNTPAQIILPDTITIEVEKHPGPTPFIPTEFILPALLIYRKKTTAAMD